MYIQNCLEKTKLMNELKITHLFCHFAHVPLENLLTLVKPEEQVWESKKHMLQYKIFTKTFLLARASIKRKKFQERLLKLRSNSPSRDSKYN